MEHNPNHNPEKDGYVDGYKYEVFVGGFVQTILSWSVNHSLKIKPVKAQNYLNVVPNVDTLLIRLIAIDSDAYVESNNRMDCVVFQIRPPLSSSSKSILRNPYVGVVINFVLCYYLF